MKNLILCLFLLISLLARPQLAYSASIDDLFYSGTSSYSQGQLDEALASFSKYLNERPNDARAHLNLATIYAKQKKWGLSWSHYRKVRSLEPQMEGLSTLKNRLEAESSPPKGLSGPYHIWIRPLVGSLNGSLILGILLVALTGFFHFLIRFIKKRKWAHEAGEPSPSLPWSLVLMIFFGLFCGVTLLLQLHLQTETYSSVLSDQAKVYNAPSEGGFEIGTLEVGSEYKVLRTQNPWVQVTNESGTSGWVNNQFLLTYPGAPQ